MNVQGINNSREGRVLELQSRIDNIEAQERDVRKLRRVARDGQAHIINTLSPVDSLPNEILAMIFEAGHTADSSFISLFEVTISHVIRRWRDVAVNTVSLWTRIDVLPTAYKHAVTYLGRSKMCFIDVRIGSKERLWHAAPANALVDVMTAISHVCRWRSFSVSSDSEED